MPNASTLRLCHTPVADTRGIIARVAATPGGGRWSNVHRWALFQRRRSYSCDVNFTVDPPWTVAVRLSWALLINAETPVVRPVTRCEAVGNPFALTVSRDEESRFFFEVRIG